MLFRDRYKTSGAVDFAGRSMNHSLDLQILGSLQHVQSPFDVRIDVGVWSDTSKELQSVLRGAAQHHTLSSPAGLRVGPGCPQQTLQIAPLNPLRNDLANPKS